MTLSRSRTSRAGERADAGEGVDRSVGQRRAHDRELRAGHPDRALVQVQREQLLDVAGEHPLGAHEVRRRAVAIRMAQLARERPLVDHQRLVAGARLHDAEQALELALGAGAVDEVRGDQRARVDHRVVRAVMPLVEDDRVERVTARLDADPGQHVLLAVVGERERVGEDLGDRLERERQLMVALVVEAAVHRGQADGEVVALLARRVGGVVAALGVVEPVDAGRVGHEVAFVELPEAGPDPGGRLGVGRTGRSLSAHWNACGSARRSRRRGAG